MNKCNINFWIIGMATFLFSNFSFSQEPLELFKEIRQNYENLQSLELNLNYELRKAGNTSIRDSYKTILRKSDKGTYAKLYQDEFISNEKVGIIVNHEFKTIQVTEPNSQNVFDENIEKSIQYCSDIRIVEAGDGKQVIMHYPLKSSIEFSKIIVNLTKDLWIKSIEITYATKMNFSRSYLYPEWGIPILKVNYSLPSVGWKDTGDKTNVFKYISEVDGSFKLNKLYQNYTLIQ